MRRQSRRLTTRPAFHLRSLTTGLPGRRGRAPGSTRNRISRTIANPGKSDSAAALATKPRGRKVAPDRSTIVLAVHPSPAVLRPPVEQDRDQVPDLAVRLIAPLIEKDAVVRLRQEASGAAAHPPVGVAGHAGMTIAASRAVREQVETIVVTRAVRGPAETNGASDAEDLSAASAPGATIAARPRDKALAVAGRTPTNARSSAASHAAARTMVIRAVNAAIPVVGLAAQVMPVGVVRVDNVATFAVASAVAARVARGDVPVALAAVAVAIAAAVAVAAAIAAALVAAIAEDRAADETTMRPRSTAMSATILSRATGPAHPTAVVAPHARPVRPAADGPTRAAASAIRANGRAAADSGRHLEAEALVPRAAGVPAVAHAATTLRAVAAFRLVARAPDRGRSVAHQDGDLIGRGATRRNKGCACAALSPTSCSYGADRTRTPMPRARSELSAR